VFGAYKKNECYLGYCDANTDQTLALYTSENEPVNGIDAFQSDPNNKLYFCTNDDLVGSWDCRAPDAEGIIKFNFRGSNPQDIKCSPTVPHQIAVCDDRKCIIVFDNRKPEKELKTKSQAHGKTIMKIAWHPSEQGIFASGSRDHIVKIWNVSDMSQPLKTLTCVDPVDRLKWIPSRNGSSRLLGVATLLGDSALSVWDIAEPSMPKWVFKQDSKGKLTDVCYLPEAAIYSTKTNSLIVQGYSHALPLLDERRARPLCCDILENYAFTFPSEQSMSHLESMSIQKLLTAVKPPQTIHFINAHSLNSCYDQKIHFTSLEEELLFFVEQYRVNTSYPFQALKDNAALCESVGKTELAKIWTSVYELLNEDDAMGKYSPIQKPVVVIPGAEPKTTINSGAIEMTSGKLPTSVPFSIGTADKTDNLVRILRYYKKRPDKFLTDLKSEKILISKRNVSESGGDIKIYLLEEYEKELLQEIALANNTGEEEELGWEHRSEAVLQVIEELIDNGEFIHGYQMYLCLSPLLHVSGEQVRVWTWTYIELLTTMGFFNKAINMVKHSNMEQLLEGMQRKLNPLNLRCVDCKTELEPNKSGECTKCQKARSCAICQKSIKGLELWCQICGHGGHFSEMKSWFAKKDASCASGCGHYCFRFY